MDRIISGYSELPKTESLHRRNKVATYVHWNICKNSEVAEKWYGHNPETVINTGSTTVTWGMPVHTDSDIKANRPDIVVKRKDEKSCPLIEVSIPGDKNTSVKVVEKLSKYKDLEIEIERMWGMKITTVPVVIGALVVIKKGTEKFMKKIPWNIRLQELQKATLLGIALILWKVLAVK